MLSIKFKQFNHKNPWKAEINRKKPEGIRGLHACFATLQNNEGLYCFCVCARQNKRKILGFSEWFESKELCEAKARAFAEGLSNKKVAVAMEATFCSPTKYYYTFLNAFGETICTVKGSCFKSLAMARLKKIYRLITGTAINF